MLLNKYPRIDIQNRDGKNPMQVAMNQDIALEMNNYAQKLHKRLEKERLSGGPDKSISIKSTDKGNPE